MSTGLARVGQNRDGGVSEAPSGTALDGHSPVPAWVDRGTSMMERLVRHASYALPGWELGWDPCRER